MADQAGKDMLLKIGDGGSPPSFTTVMGVTTKTLTFNTEQVDVTDGDSVNRWRELLAGAGIRSMSASGEGIFAAATTDTSVKDSAINNTHLNWQVVVPGFGTFEGPFEISSLEYTGEHNGAAQYSISLESAGEISFEAA